MDARRVARVTVILLFVAWLIDYIDRLVISIALPDIGKTFQLNTIELGGIMSAFALTYAIFQIPGGFISDRLGARKAMTLSLTLWSIFTGLTGIVSSYVGLLFVRGLFGITEGTFPAASMKAISERVRPSQRVTANSWMLSSNSFGAALAPLIAAPAIVLLGWRHAFFMIMGLGIIIAIVLWIWLPRTAVAHETTAPTAVDASLDSDTVGESTRDVLQSGLIWRFAIMFGTFDIVIWGLLAWVPTYLVDARHVHLIATGVLVAIPWFAGAIGTILGGWLFDRVFHAHFRRLVVSVEVLGIIFLILMATASSVTAYVTFMTIALFFLQMAFLPIFGLPIRLLSAKVMASGGSIINFGGQAGGFLAPILMGIIINQISYTAGFALLVVALAASVVTAFTIPESPDHFRKALQHTPTEATLT
ncbi:MAG: MFS transporter [Sulfobacillus benefaciens]|uniref:MFS transporter n=1 Tax=Sulfobacillus benefaciens TaxID=453960 RepID=A0A2T2WWE0_9FIRM|nr:MAG: MFS transporter [Sulfobacillus benefaciens]